MKLVWISLRCNKCKIEIQPHLGNAFWAQSDIFILGPFGITPESGGDIRLNRTVDNSMRNMDVLFPKFLVKTLGEATDAVFPSSEGCKCIVPTPRGCSRPMEIVNINIKEMT